jgi:hypothetical protein
MPLATITVDLFPDTAASPGRAVLAHHSQSVAVPVPFTSTKEPTMFTTITTPSDDLVARAYRAAIGQESGRAALSAIGGAVQAKSVLEQASDTQLIRAMTPEQLKIATVMEGSDDSQAIAQNARRVALAALAKSERDAGADVIGMALSTVQGRR